MLHHIHRYHKHIISVMAVISLTLGLVGSVAPIAPETAEAVVYTPLNNQRAKDFAIIRQGATWHVFAIWCDITLGCDAQRRGLMHLTSTDLKNWTEVGFVLAPDGGSDFDDYDIWAPSIVERDGTYYMYYTGVYKNGSNTLVQKIGLATSTDLNNWTKYSTTPVFDCAGMTGAYYNTADSGDGAACRDPFVYWDEGEHQWVMVVSSRRTGSVPANLMSLALVTSEDLINWQEYGFITASDDYIAESAHIFEHSGTYYMVFTENGSGTDYLDYLTSTNLYSGWTRIGDLSPAAIYEYASEYIADGGREYFARIDATNVGIDFDELVWSGTPFSMSDPQYANIGDAVWSDTNEDGVYDGGESGIDNVALSLYLDDGDGIFDVDVDDLSQTVTTGDDPNTGGTQHGYFQFTDVLPDTYWVSIDPSNYDDGGALAGRVATTSNTVAEVTVTDNQTVANFDIGFGLTGTTWPLSTGGNFTVNSEAALANGRVGTAVNAEAVDWWDGNWKYRRAITVTTDTESIETSNTLDLGYDVSALVSDGKMQADYDDLRVVYWNGSENLELDVDILAVDSQRIQAQAAIGTSSSDANYYMYYGNPDAPSRPTRLAGVYDYYASFNAKDQASYGTWTESTNDWNVVANRWAFTGTAIEADRFTRDPSKTFSLGDDWNLEATGRINSGQAMMPVFHSTQAFGNEEYQLNYDATNDLIEVFHWAYGPVGFVPQDAAVTINTGTDYRMRFLYDYTSAALRHQYGYLDGALILPASEPRGGADLSYDIWYEESCPCTDKDANPALGVYNSQSTFNDVKVWEEVDGLTVSVSATESEYYPERDGTIRPVVGQGVSFGALTEFRASVLEQSGSVRFVLSNDGGTSWLYHNGSGWVASDQTSSQANTATDIDSNATAFPHGEGALLWKALLTSAGDQRPTLLQVGATVNVFPSSPGLSTPANGSSEVDFSPVFMLSSTDPENDSVQYEIQLDTVSTFNSPDLQTFSQAETQSGWSGQDADGGTAFASGSSGTYSMTSPLKNDTYYWRARSVDPNGSNVYSAYSSTYSFSTPAAIVISGVAAESVSANAATIRWTTSQPGTSQLEFGPDESYGSTTGESQTLKTDHTLTLTGLEPLTTYHVRVISRDAGGNTSRSADLSLTTLSSTVISNVRVVAGERAFTVWWKTNELATSRVRYGKYVLDHEVKSQTKQIWHRLQIPNLDPGTRYTYLIESVGSSVGTTSRLSVTTNTPDSKLNRAIPPTLFRPLLRDGERPSVTIVGLARGGQTVRIFIDGRVRKTIVLPGMQANIKPFAARISLDRFVNGRHSYYAQTTDDVGRTSLVRKKYSFVLTASGTARGFVSRTETVYVATFGDTMWSIAERFLGDGRRFQEVINANLERYPILKQLPWLVLPGWSLLIPAR